MILMKLSYKDLLRLQVVSKAMSRTINPQIASEEDKIALVIAAEKDFEANYKKKEDAHWMVGYGCYVCYRVIDSSEFAFEQYCTHFPTHLRRYCINCGLERGYYQPGDTLKKRDQTDIWICKCKQINDKATTIFCNRCAMNMPLRKREEQCVA
ncbi:hypothetical protein TruAng_003091 [Truncatella angustata]|nr:hypothetical protein TruAng_003091 [Truncatella angustata]